MSNTLIAKTIAASEQWQAFFNQGDGAGCASMYEEQAQMIAGEFGAYQGRQQIEAFWNNLIQQGFKAITYINPNIEQLDETSTLLTSHWAMNKAQGVITRELWVLQSDGTMRLREDHFEVSDPKAE